MDGSVDRDTPDELSFSAIVITVYFIWGVIFLLLVIALCIVGLVPLANNLRYKKHPNFFFLTFYREDLGKYILTNKFVSFSSP